MRERERERERERCNLNKGLLLGLVFLCKALNIVQRNGKIRMSFVKSLT